MVVRCIFEKNKGLFAVSFQYSPFVGEVSPEIDELDIAFDRWRDAIWLRDFFIKFRSDLATFDPMLNVKGAVRQVMEEAEKIYDTLRAPGVDLNKRFKPLDNREPVALAYDLQKLKATGDHRRSMIRLYALRLDNMFIVTGSAVKLTHKMQGRQHLMDELYKLEVARAYLKKSGADAAFVYLSV